MPSIDYAALAAAVAATVGDAADEQEVQIRRVSDGAAVSTPWKPGEPSETDESVPAVVVDEDASKSRGETGRSIQDATLIQRATRTVLVAADALSGAEPTTADYVVIDGHPHKVVGVGRVAPGGVALLYKLRVQA